MLSGHTSRSWTGMCLCPTGLPGQLSHRASPKRKPHAILPETLLPLQDPALPISVAPSL